MLSLSIEKWEGKEKEGDLVTPNLSSFLNFLRECSEWQRPTEPSWLQHSLGGGDEPDVLKNMQDRHLSAVHLTDSFKVAHAVLIQPFLFHLKFSTFPSMLQYIK